MPQDAFTIKYVAQELKEALVGSKISKISQPERDTLLFIIYTKFGSVKLEICLSAVGCRINMPENDSPAPKVAPNFCMLLRKHLQNAEILDVVQIKHERIIYLEFNCVSEFETRKMRLYAELMGKYSNALLVADGIIVGALKTSAIGENTRRVLFAGAEYSLPEPQDKIAPDDLSAIEAALKNAYGDRAKFISENVKGVAYSTASAIVRTYGESVTGRQIYDYLNGEANFPCVIFEDGEPKDFAAIGFPEGEKKDFTTVLGAQAYYYAYAVGKRNFGNAKRRLESALSAKIKKSEKLLASINEKLLSCQDMESVKLKGELITANIYSINRGDEFLEAVNYYDENCGKIKISLDKSLSPSQNAQKYYKKYAKLRRTKESVTEQKTEAEQKLDYLYSLRSHLFTAENADDLSVLEEEFKVCGIIKEEKTKKKAEPRSPYRAYTYGGYKIYAGRNNLQNDRLVKELAADDLWFHTKGYHSSHAAVIAEGRTVPDEVIKFTAEICAYYSDGRAGNKIPVDYAFKKHLKKPKGAAAGFVVYTENKTALANPDAHAEARIDIERQ